MSLDQFYRAENGSQGVASYCKPCHTARNVRTRTPEKQRAHYAANREEIRAYHTVWRAKNADKLNAAKVIQRRALREDVIEGMGGMCACCGEVIFEFLTIDHIHGGGAQERRTFTSQQLLYKLRREGFPTGQYRVLCYNCNNALGVYEICPHENDSFMPPGSR